MVNNSILLRRLSGTVAVASINTGSNFFASSITFTASGDHLPGNGYLFIEGSFATANVLNLRLDDGGASANVFLINKEAQTTLCSANTLYHFEANVDQNFAYNFRTSTVSGTVNLFNVYFVPWG